MNVRRGWVGASRPNCVKSDRAGNKSLSDAMAGWWYLGWVICRDFGKGKPVLSRKCDHNETIMLRFGLAGWPARAEKMPVPLPPILHQDDALLAFDKPAGLLVAPDRWDKSRENLMALVHARFGPGVANVHRLDAATSGLLLCAQTKPALDFLTGQFQARTVGKIYHAFVAGQPALDEFTVELALGPDERQPGR